MVIANVGAGVNVWTDVLVPLGSALLGGALAILGGYLAARWAASYQNEQAERIAHRIRRDEREETALIEIDAVLHHLEEEIDNLLRGTEDLPGQLDTDLTGHLSERLYSFNREWTRLARRISDIGAGHVLSTFPATGRADELGEIQERRRASRDSSEAIEWLNKLREQVLGMREQISDTIDHLVHRQEEGLTR
jgi:hypothetical protein